MVSALFLLLIGPFAWACLWAAYFVGKARGRHLERLRTAKAIEDWEAQLVLKQSAAAFQRASNPGLRVIRGGER